MTAAVVDRVPRGDLRAPSELGLEHIVDDAEEDWLGLGAQDAKERDLDPRVMPVGAERLERVVEVRREPEADGLALQHLPSQRPLQTTEAPSCS